MALSGNVSQRKDSKHAAHAAVLVRSVSGLSLS